MRLLLLLVAFLLTIAQCQYKVTSKDEGSTYVRLQLAYTGTHEYYVKPKSIVIKQLVFHFKSHTSSDFSFKIYDPNNARF